MWNAVFFKFLTDIKHAGTSDQGTDFHHRETGDGGRGNLDVEQETTAILHIQIMGDLRLVVVLRRSDGAGVVR